MGNKLPKKMLMHNRIKRAKKDLEKISHDFVRNRDSVREGEFAGSCCTCGLYCEGGNFQAGHYEPSGSCGALLRYHPQNMHGQGGYCCNINRNHQQKMGNDYTFFMINKYGRKRVEEIRALKHKSVYADIIFYQTMIELYRQGNEANIINYLENICIKT